MNSLELMSKLYGFRHFDEHSVKFGCIQNQSQPPNECSNTVKVRKVFKFLQNKEYGRIGLDGEQ